MPLLRMFPQLRAMLAMFAVLLTVMAWDTLVQPIITLIVRALTITIPIPKLPDIHLDRAANAVRDGAAFVRRSLGSLLAVMVFPAVVILQYATRLVLEQAREVASLTADTTSTIMALRKYVIPAMIAAKVAWIPRHLVALEREVASLAHRAPLHIVHTITKVATQQMTTVVNKAVAVPWPRIRHAERDASAAWKRVNSLAKRVAPAALAAAVVATIARSSFRWLRCSRVRSAGQRVCGMDTDLLDSLIAGSFLIVGTMSLREFTQAMQESMDTITPQVSKFWRA